MIFTSKFCLNFLLGTGGIPQAPALARAANTQDTERVVTPGLGGKGPQTNSTTLERSPKIFREEPAQPKAQEADERQVRNLFGN